MKRSIFIRCLLLVILYLAPLRGLHAQVITSFSPLYGAAGDTVTIQGSGFATGTITVRFWNGVVATDKYINGDLTITVMHVPSGVSTGPISVQLDSGSQHYSPEIFTVVGPGPYVESVDPNYGAVGDTILIHGVHFAAGSAVKFGGVTASSYPNGAGDQITAYVPSIAPGDVPLTVTASGITFTNPAPFTVVGSGPYIASFTPPAGSETTPVTLNGLHFAQPTSVYFNGQSAGSYNPPSSTLMQIPAPYGVTTGPIKVTTSAGSYTTSNSFYGAIRLNGFSPAKGPVGTQVLVQGTNFTGATSVKFVKSEDFTGVNAEFVVSNNNQLIATVPTNAPTGIIVVTTPAGSLWLPTNFVVTPSILSFTPHSGPQGTPVQINGTRLVDNGGGKPTVKFNGVSSSSISSWSSQQVVAVAPASSSGYITLTTADGTSTSASRFYYPPQITSFTPNASPPGTQVTITGQSFVDASSVLFGGVPSTNFAVLSNTSIQAEVPTGITTGPITVSTPGGTVNSTALYYAAPVITAFAPGSGGPGTSVTVFGTSFQGTTSVKFHGTNASFSNVTSSQLTTVVPDGALTGPITVTAPAGTATSAENFVVPQSSDLAIDTFTDTPDPVTVGGSLTLTINPANLGPNNASNVTAAVALGPNLVVRSASTTQGAAYTNFNPVVFSLGTMTTNDHPILSLVLAPLAAGSVTNTVTLGSTTYDPDTTNNVSSRVTTVLPFAELNIKPDGTNQVRVAWPVLLTNWTLQSAASLSNSPPWATVTTPAVIEGDERVVVQPGTGATRFFRLKK